MTLEDIYLKVSQETGIPVKIVNKTYRAYWKAVREHVSSLPLKEDLTEEQFKELQPNVNIPSIGKLHVTYDRYRKVKSVYNHLIEKSNVAH